MKSIIVIMSLLLLLAIIIILLLVWVLVEVIRHKLVICNDEPSAMIDVSLLFGPNTHDIEPDVEKDWKPIPKPFSDRLEEQANKQRMQILL